jgi:hypothetical protein
VAIFWAPVAMHRGGVANPHKPEVVCARSSGRTLQSCDGNVTE